jgi:hypothetical protein
MVTSRSRKFVRVEFKNPYAYLNGQIVSASEVEASQGFHCVSCFGPMIVKRGNRRRIHFAHKANACNVNAESALHIIGKECLSQFDEFTLKDPKTGRFRKITGFLATKEVKIGPLRVDILLDFPRSQKKLAVEIAVTHHCDENKVLEFRNMNLPAIEISLSRLDKEMFSLADVKSEILSELRNPNWLYNEKLNEASGKRWKW